MRDIALEQLKSRLDYNPDTGDFIWRPFFGAKKPGQIAGIIHPNGYRYIAIRPYRSYRAHRLAWFYMTGQWPKDQIDHINRIKTDNRFCNLREANSSEQQANTKVLRTNKLGVRGVCKASKGPSYRAVIWVNGKSKHLGSYKTIEEAQAVYEQEARKHFKHFYT